MIVVATTDERKNCSFQTFCTIATNDDGWEFDARIQQAVMGGSTLYY